MKYFFILLIGLGLLQYPASEQVLRKPIPNKLVVLTFDDAVLSHATIVAPMLKKYGFGATFFVCEFLNPPFADKTKYMSWEQIASLHNMGFEVANHTQNHTHVGKMDSTRFVAELRYIEQKCAEYGIPKPLCFAYPGYETNARAFKVLQAQGYCFARAGGSRAYDPQTDNPYLIPSFSTSAKNSTDVFKAFEQAKEGKIVVLTVHGVPDSAHAWVNTPPELFESYLQYLKKNHYKVISLGALSKYINPQAAYLQNKQAKL